jgi:hypothetical protein
MSARDMLHVLTDPLKIVGSEITWPCAFVMALHVHHCIFYSLNKLDIIHHGVMCGIMLIPMMACNAIFIEYCNYCLFFVCGLPGCIDYAFMTFVAEGILQSQTEKYINTLLNMWLRAPGLMYAVFILYIRWLQNDIHSYYALPVMAALFWNAQYFSKVVAMSAGAHGLHN